MTYITKLNIHRSEICGVVPITIRIPPVDSVTGNTCKQSDARLP